MPDTNKSRDQGGQSAPKPSRTLPDKAICRVRRGGLADLLHCLVPEPDECEYAEPHAGDMFCFHPKRDEILARTEGRFDN
jgi:hypothetical protein